MTRLVFHLDREAIPVTSENGEIHVWLYGPSPPNDHAGSVGSQALDVASRFVVRPSTAAIDFLSIAMAVTAADTFVLRDDAPDRWSRSFEIALPLSEPSRWLPLKPKLEAALRFLSADQWSFTFLPNGAAPPSLTEIRNRHRVTDLSKVDCVSLFSGGLDSGIGALDLIGAGRRPLLVSHAPRGDAEHQVAVANLLPADCQRVSINSYPTWAGGDDDSMRTRSFQFLGLGALAAQALASFRGLASVDLFICENGFIGLNPPLTPRRLGAHSTRTAHPFFLQSIQELLSDANLPVRIRNPYALKTKGEMIEAHSKTRGFDQFVAETVSCGKWKRKNQQCGRCLPCLIRRSSLHAANRADLTSYQTTVLTSVMADEDARDDILAVQTAFLRLKDDKLKSWILQAGPLPSDLGERDEYFDVVRRGLVEIGSYLASQGLAV